MSFSKRSEDNAKIFLEKCGSDIYLSHELEKLPLACDICDQAITLQNQIAIHYHPFFTLPELWVCVSCKHFDEDTLLTMYFKRKRANRKQKTENRQ